MRLSFAGVLLLVPFAAFFAIAGACSSDPNCATCSGTCSQCSSYSTLVNGICECTVENCQVCASSQCTTCDSKFSMHNDNCVRDDSVIFVVWLTTMIAGGIATCLAVATSFLDKQLGYVFACFNFF